MTTPPPADNTPGAPEPATERTPPDPPEPPHGWTSPDTPEPPDATEPAGDWAPPDAEPAGEWAAPDATPPAGHAPPPAERLPAGLPAPETPPHFHGPQPPATPARTNRLAIAALLTGLLGLIVFAVVFAAAALVQTGRRGEKGRLLAIGGLAASLAWTAAIAVVLTVVPADPDDSAPTGTSGQPRASTLKAGTCFIGFEEKGTAIFMKAAPCNGAHEGEIAAQATMPDGRFPGDEAVLVHSEATCQNGTRVLQKTGRADEFRLHIDRPDEHAWRRGNRTVTCVLRYVGPSRLTDPLKDLVVGPRNSTDLVPGACIQKWDDVGSVTVVECTKEHKIQVYAVFDLKGDTLPSARVMEAEAAKGCAERAAKIWGANPPKNVVPSFVGPNSVLWEMDERQIVCMFEAVNGGSLKRSLIPE